MQRKAKAPQKLGVFGFISSEDIKQYGQLNAGLLDMELSLKWVKTYARLFGGDVDQVTIAGESAGGGAVMLFTMLYGGTIGDSLFSQGIAASPYLPRQHNYDDHTPATFYKELLNSTDCDSGSSKRSRFDCLVELDAVTLSAAGSMIDGIDADFTRGFAPVTDGVIIQDIPSRQLYPGRVNGRRMLAGVSEVQYALNLLKKANMLEANAAEVTNMATPGRTMQTKVSSLSLVESPHPMTLTITLQSTSPNLHLTMCPS